MTCTGSAAMSLIRLRRSEPGPAPAPPPEQRCVSGLAWYLA